MRRNVGKDIEELSLALHTGEEVRGTARKCAAGCQSLHSHYTKTRSKSRKRNRQAEGNEKTSVSTGEGVSNGLQTSPPTLDKFSSTDKTLSGDNSHTQLRLLPLPHAKAHHTEKTLPPKVPHTHCEMALGEVVDYYALSMRRLTGRYQDLTASEPSLSRLRASLTERMGDSLRLGTERCEFCSFLLSRGFSTKNCSQHSHY